jgi:hypothetical protein
MDPNMYITESQLSVGLLRNGTAYRRDGTAANKKYQHTIFVITITHTKQEAPRMKMYVHTPYHIEFETHPTLKIGFSGGGGFLQANTFHSP